MFIFYHYFDIKKVKRIVSIPKKYDASYVGQTGRQLKTRIAEHRKHINWNTTIRSVITEHKMQTPHDFHWDNIKVLDKEPCYNKRLISEINIKNQALIVKSVQKVLIKYIRGLAIK